jgi:phage gp16-like protein
MAQGNNTNRDKMRLALLAKVHIARAKLCIEEDDYRDIIEAHAPGKRSSRQLNINQLKNVIRYFESKGFKVQGAGRKAQGGYQVTALRIRARGLLDKALDEGLVTSASGLVKKICGVDELNWCKDAGKLKRLLAVLESINSGQARGPAPTRGTHAF